MVPGGEYTEDKEQSEDNSYIVGRSTTVEVNMFMGMAIVVNESGTHAGKPPNLAKL